MSVSGKKMMPGMLLLLMPGYFAMADKIGEYCWSNQECQETEYCLFDTCAAETGICVERPMGCPDVWDPVCGCNGITYGNACEAAMAGVTVDYVGECESRYCWSNAECPDTQYCLFDTCAAETGVCVERPMGCPDVWDPVCGCNGITYGNACEAAMAGVTVDYVGECEPRYCWSNDHCPDTHFCYAPTCHFVAGICVEVPSDCPDIWEPVCGCDGNTYDNHCYAAMNGMIVSYEGECVSCGVNEYCSEEQYCVLEDCAQEIGVCQTLADISQCTRSWEPVCGCDGETYPNSCIAATAGVNVDYSGECGYPYCWSNGDCEDADYCLFDGCAAETGDCVPRPQACYEIWDPVCGCDGNTYSNACFAAMAGVTVDYAGECLPDYCWSNDNCPDTEYCLFTFCEAETGTCVDRPMDCPDIWDPVCGCDGNTYSNDCYAAIAGISVAYEGECTSCWSNQDCEEDDYCYFEVCAQETGVCRTRPTECPTFWAPVCGCDGQTYPNSCSAAAVGVSVDYEGACEGISCWENADCGEPGYCFFADCLMETGECRLRPQGCPEILDPVCGCDGFTYDNACEAAAAGMSLAYEATCLKGDFNLNGIVDCVDYVSFERCMWGPGQIWPHGWDCTAADFDNDLDVDLQDFAGFQAAFEGPDLPTIVEYSNSGCLSMKTDKGAYPCPEDDSLSITVLDEGVSFVHHNATYNCCPDEIEVALTVEGNILHLQETEILTTPCYCICCYEVYSQAGGLESGEYQVDYCWYDYESNAERCVQQSVTVE